MNNPTANICAGLTLDQLEAAHLPRLSAGELQAMRIHVAGEYTRHCARERTSKKHRRDISRLLALHAKCLAEVGRRNKPPALTVVQGGKP